MDTDSRTVGARRIPRQQQSEITIQEAYFAWLYQLVHDRVDLTVVCRLMHQVEFTPLVPYDENRVAVAAGLRNEFQELSGSLGPGEAADLMGPDASVFEVLIGFAGQADDMIALSLKSWFQIFTENLGLDRYDDEYLLRRSTYPVESIINKFNNRDYRPNGRGGIFPLKHPKHDQREVELWYQMGDYMNENRMY